MTLDYDAALAYLLAPTDPAKPVVARPDAGLNLPRMRRLLALLGDPDRSYGAVVIAGTKGKGSTSAILDSLLRASGLRAGFYSQPHLHSYRERIRVEGAPISRDHLAAATDRLRAAVDELYRTDANLGQLSTYDLGTALALSYFAEADVDLAVLEVGLGGRFDSVNSVVPLVSAITSISIDHTAVLGATIPAIASEKAGIIKPGVPVVSHPQAPDAWEVLRAEADRQRAPLWPAGDLVRVEALAEQPDPAQGRQRLLLHLNDVDRQALRLPAAIATDLPLPGAVQRDNAATAIAVALLLARRGAVVLTGETLAQGLAATYWPGRLEIVGRHPLTIVDGAHNVDSAQQLARTLRDLFPERPVTLVLGTSSDKDIRGIVDVLAPLASKLILTVSAHPRSAPLEDLRQAARRHPIETQERETVAAALDLAATITPPEGLICVTGSLFVVAEAREYYGLDSVMKRFDPH